MENDKILQYCWRHKLFGQHLYTTNCKLVEICDPGLYDKKHGSRFFNAKVRIDGLLLVGNVLVVDFAHDFFESFDDYKKESENILLVVCNVETQQCIDAKGRVIPVVEVEVPDYVYKNYNILMSELGMVHCHHHIKDFTSPLVYHAWLAALQTEHLENESERVLSVYKRSHDWQIAFDIQLFRAFGFVANADYMEKVYMTIPTVFWNNHIDNVFQLEAVLFGQAGLLELDNVLEKYQQKTLFEGYFTKLRNEWLYLSYKYQMPKLDKYEWKPFGKGKHITPHVLLSMLANMLYMRKTCFGFLTAVKNIGEVFELVNVCCTPYWEMHTQFGKLTERSKKKLTRNRQSRILMACHIPFLFSYGRHTNKEELCDRAFDIMEKMALYRTPEIAWFERFGIKPNTAGETVGLCLLKERYCDKRNCLSCRFGREFIINNTKW